MLDATDTNAMSEVPVTSQWGASVVGGFNGFQIVPDVLLRNQHSLGLNSTDVVVLLQVLMHWWARDPANLPRPRPTQIAKRMGTTVRTVDRALARLERKGLLKRLRWERHGHGPKVRRFDPQGLVEILEKLAAASTQPS